MKNLAAFTLLFCLHFFSTANAQTDSVNSTDTDTIYEHLDELPEFPGGGMEMTRYLRANLQYPDEAREHNLQGMVFVEFVVKADGRLTNIAVLHGAHPILDSAAMEAVSRMPRWTPGKIDGQYVRSKFVVPIEFRLDNKGVRRARRADRRNR